MYKSRSWKDIQKESGLTRTGNKSKASVLAGIGSGRWNKGALPKGAQKTTGGKFGQTKTGR